LKITILYDNRAKPRLTRSWGFSALIEIRGEKILFDTGWDPLILESNAKKLGIKLENVSRIVLSHQHWDHISGLSYILHKLKNTPQIYVPKSFSKHLKDEISNMSSLFEVSKDMEICKDVITTGELKKGNIAEQSLILKSAKGLVIITGCAHPGIDAVISKARKFGKLYAIIGGFHDWKDLKIFDTFQVLAPCHCTTNREKIKEQYPSRFVDACAGTTLFF